MACTERNPAFCGDGVCIDPTRPYCDVDGALGGTPNECVAVECTPAELEICRGDVAVTCNSTGTNFDDTNCPLGCAPSAAGCRQCVDGSQCTEAATPICDSNVGACRACAADDECDSRVCDFDSGSCVPEASIVYATAADVFGTCTLAQPCPLAQAVVLATNAAVTPTLRLLPGTYTLQLEVRVSTPTPLKVIGTGATIAMVGDSPAVEVSNGGSVQIRNLTSTSQKAILCGEANATPSSLSLEKGSLTAIGQGTQIEIERCALTLTEMELFIGEQDLLGTRDDATFKADRIHAQGNGWALIFAGARGNVQVTNSLLENTALVSFNNDAAAPGTHLNFAYNTMLFSQSSQICAGPTTTFRSVVFENNVIAAGGGFDPFPNLNPANCTFAKTLLSRQANPPSGILVADPMFADQTARDFHLLATSPAVDAAVAGSISPSIDLDGIGRPQGVAADLGAYELAQ